MPDRYLREGLLRSERWNRLSLDARDLYVRLVLIADDYGCFDGRDFVIVHTAYYFGRTEALPLEALHQADLILRYTNGGKPFIAITQWGEGYRGKRRYPAPPVFNDRPGIAYRGVYGRPLNWTNPTGSEPTSVLLDLNGNRVVPQPPEWRRTTDWMPLHAVTAEVTTPVTREVTPPVTEPKRSHLRSDLPSVGPSYSSSSPVTHQPSAVAAVVEVHPPPVTSQVTTNPTPPPTNGKVQLDSNGAWQGVDHAQRARWQEMFSDLAIDDQIERAGAWLLVHPEERAIYEKQDDGLRAYLIRWLLREARTGPASRGADSQGKR